MDMEHLWPRLHLAPKCDFCHPIAPLGSDLTGWAFDAVKPPNMHKQCEEMWGKVNSTQITFIISKNKCLCLREN
jgi:hypothetical protein